MIQWLTQLDDANVTLSFLDLLMLTKKLLCVDQLQPDTPKGSHFRLFEAHALMSRLLAHARVWPHVVRVPISYFDSAPQYMARRSARYYVKAVTAAADDVQQRVRLMVEQCKVLDNVGLLQEARKVSHQTQYPSAPFDTLVALHTQYPAAGPPMDLSTLQQLDAELDTWRTQLEAARQRVTQLEQGDIIDVGAHQQAQAEVDELVAAPPPRTFEQRMGQSQLFFHPDKRRQDTDTSAEDKAAQFSQVKEAWAALAACRPLFHELRSFRHLVKAAKKTAAAAAAAQDRAEEQDY